MFLVLNTVGEILHVNREINENCPENRMYSYNAVQRSCALSRHTRMTRRRQREKKRQIENVY